MIPKTIHYCWFGGKTKPILAARCISSWKKYCPDFEIKEWNEENFSIPEAPLYVKQAYKMGKYAFVSDYARLKIIEKHGGVYFDTDVELLKPIEDLLQYNGFFASEVQDGSTISTGLGFGAVVAHPLVIQMRQIYENAFFLDSNGEMDLTPCPLRQTEAIRTTLGKQCITRVLHIDNDVFLPRDYFNPMDYISRKMFFKSKNTYAIHWGASSWMSSEQLEARKQGQKKRAFYLFLKSLFGVRLQRIAEDIFHRHKG